MDLQSPLTFALESFHLSRVEELSIRHLMPARCNTIKGNARTETTRQMFLAENKRNLSALAFLLANWSSLSVCVSAGERFFFGVLLVLVVFALFIYADLQITCIRPSLSRAGESL